MLTLKHKTVNSSNRSNGEVTVGDPYSASHCHLGHGDDSDGYWLRWSDEESLKTGCAWDEKQSKVYVWQYQL